MGILRPIIPTQPLPHVSGWMAVLGLTIHIVHGEWGRACWVPFSSISTLKRLVV